MKQTPVELLRFEYRKTLAGVTVNISQAMRLADAFDEANELFKQEIQNAFYKGIQEQTARTLVNAEQTTPEQYYNKTFNNK